MRYEYSTVTEGLRSERPIVLPDSPDMNRTDKAVIWMSNVQVYSFAVMFSVSVLTRQSDLGLVFGGDRPDGAPEGFAPVLLGVELADGTTASLDRRAPRGVVLEVRNSAGHAGSLHANVFLGPIPPPGPVQFITAIPLLGVSEATVSIDGERIISASERVERLWASPKMSQGLGGAGNRGGGWFNRLN